MAPRPRSTGGRASTGLRSSATTSGRCSSISSSLVSRAILFEWGEEREVRVVGIARSLFAGLLYSHEAARVRFAKVNRQLKLFAKMVEE